MRNQYKVLQEKYSTLQEASTHPVIPFAQAVKMVNNVGQPNFHKSHGTDFGVGYYVTYTLWCANNPGKLLDDALGSPLLDLEHYCLARAEWYLMGRTSPGSLTPTPNRYIAVLDPVLDKVIITCKWYKVDEQNNKELVLVQMLVDSEAYKIELGLKPDQSVFKKDKIIKLIQSRLDNPDWQSIIDAAVDIFVDFKKAKEIYKQGTQDTGGDWNIGGLDEAYFDPDDLDNSSPDFKELPYDKYIQELIDCETWHDFKNTAEAIDKRLGGPELIGDVVRHRDNFYRALDEFDYSTGVKNPEKQLILNLIGLQAVYWKAINSSPGEMAEAFNRWSKWKKQYTEWLKSQEIYKQGTQDTGGDWNIGGLT